MERIDSFRRKYFFLSNYQPSVFLAGIWENFEDENDLEVWATVEHFFQAMKTEDLQERTWVRTAETPGEAKRLGQNVKLREGWEELKDMVMYFALEKKFNIPGFKKKLLETGNAELIEGNNWHDNYWGNCICDKCKDIEGLNKLGTMLMEIRVKHQKALEL